MNKIQLPFWLFILAVGGNDMTQDLEKQGQ